MARYCALLLFARTLLTQAPVAAAGPPPIQDNSFLIEEAYNQEPGVVQHISTFSRMWNSRDWSYTFTQEWPGRRNPRNQYSFSVAGVHSGGFPETNAGWGDVALNYRYQVTGNGESRFAFAPRLTLLVPTGDVELGRGIGGLGFQTMLPFSVILHPRLVWHTNAGATFVPNAQNPSHGHAPTAGYNFGQSLVYLAHPRFNVLVEAVDNRFQSVVLPGQTAWSRTMYVSPGIRWAYNFESGLQIVPGLAVPIGVGPSQGEKGLFLYLSFEHPMPWFYSK